jgi:glycerate dehydrogenase
MKIAILDGKTLTNVSIEQLQQLGDVVRYETTQASEVLSRLNQVDVAITNKVVLDEHILTQLPQLKLICIAATGTNNVCLKTAKQQGIAVCNVAGYSTPSVVQHTFTALGNLMTNIHRYAADCQQDRWQASDIFCRLDYPIHEIHNKTFVIVGHGTLGQAVATVAKAFGANVIIAEQKTATDVREGRVAFNQAIQQADIISIHCPLNEDTRNLFSTAELVQMKPTALLINTARGGIVDEAALTAALENKQIAGAAVDVLSKEPAEHNNPLLSYKGHNLLLTPHIAWASQESIARLVNEIALNIIAFNNKETRNRVA